MLLCEALIINVPPNAVPTSTIHFLSSVINRLNSLTGHRSDGELCEVIVRAFRCSSLFIHHVALAYDGNNVT